MNANDIKQSHKTNQSQQEVVILQPQINEGYEKII